MSLSSLAWATVAHSADGLSTFESFYSQGLHIGWWFAGIAALLVGILVFVGLPVLTPAIAGLVNSIGGSVGSLFGLQGIAATNFGLSLLGGGAVASGGFGIAGGTALLAAALTFGTNVTFDYAIGSMTSKYEATKFAEASTKMMTLPVPVNTSGPESVKAAGKALDFTVITDSWACIKEYPDSLSHINQCVAARQKPQRQLIRDALAAMDANRNSTAKSELEREFAMYALLQFLNNDYVAAKRSALRSYELGVQANGTPTQPAFIYAASLLYDDSPNLDESFGKFQFAVTAEPKNPLTPVLFSAYLDRLSYRINDGAADIGQIERLSKFAELLANDPRKLYVEMCRT